MPGPAAKLGSMTAHGGSVVGPGCPTVLINKMPAIRMGPDMHLCPMVTPGTPPIPHVGMTCVGPGVPTVLIGKMPAATIGDQFLCVGPPAPIITGAFDVIIGTGGGGGSGGGGGGGGAGVGGGSVSAAQAALISAAIAGQSAETEETSVHSIKAEYLDKAKNPVGGLRYSIDLGGGKEMAGPLAGPIFKGGVDEGSYDITLRGITNIQWSKTDVEVGETVDMIVETVGVTSEKAVFVIYVRDGSYTDYELATIEATVNGDQAKASWKLEVDEKFIKIAEKKGEKKRYSQPFFIFKVTIGDLFEQSGMLYAKDWVEVDIVDDEGEPIAQKDYTVLYSSGEVKTGKTDDSGNIKVEGVPPGTCTIQYNLRNEK